MLILIPFETVTKINSGYVMYRPFSNGHKFPFGCAGNGYVTPMRHYSGVGIFTVAGIISVPPPGKFVFEGLALNLIFISLV